MERKNDLTMIHEKLLMLSAGVIEYETWYHDIVQWARSYLTESKQDKEHTQNTRTTTLQVKAPPHVR